MTTLYKVLVDGEAAHGGDYTYGLPTQDNDGTWTPGGWTEPLDRVAICTRGYHLTTAPEKWLRVNCTVYEAEGTGAQANEDDKTAYESVRLLRPAPEAMPAYWPKVEQFICDLGNIQWFRPDGRPNPEWRLFTAPTLSAARDAAWATARAIAWDAAWDAAWAAARATARATAREAVWAAARATARATAWTATRDAARDAAWAAADKAAFLTVADLDVDPKHHAVIDQRWAVWQKGYCLLCEIDGVLYVYAREETQ